MMPDLPPLTPTDEAIIRRTYTGVSWPVPQLLAEIDRLRGALAESDQGCPACGVRHSLIAAEEAEGGR